MGRHVLFALLLSALGFVAALAGLFGQTRGEFWNTVLVVGGAVLAAIGVGYFSRVCSDAAFVVLVNAMNGVQKAAQPVIWILGGVLLLFSAGFAATAVIPDTLDLESVILAYVFGLIGLGVLRAQFVYVAPVLSTTSRTNAEQRYFITLLASWVPGFTLILYTVLFVGKSLDGGAVVIGVFIAVLTSMFLAIAARRIAFRNAFKELLEVFAEMYFAHEGMRQDPKSLATQERVTASYFDLERIAASNPSMPWGFGVMPSLDFELRAAILFARSHIAPNESVALTALQLEFFDRNFPKGVTVADGARLAQDLYRALLHGAPARNAPNLLRHAKNAAAPGDGRFKA